MSIGHDQLANKLADHLAERSDRMIWLDMNAGKAGSQRPDVYTMMKSYANPKPLTYEVKVSKSDFRSDITKGKWQGYLEYSSGVTFCAPLGIIGKSDLPNGCGLITWNPETDTFRTVKAPTLQKVTLPQELLLKLLIDGVKKARAPKIRIRECSAYLTEKKLREQQGDLIADYFRDSTSAINQANIRLKRVQNTADEIERRNKQRTESSQEQIKTLWSDIGSAIGKPGADQFTIRRTINELAKAVSTDAAVNDLSQQLETVRRTVNSLPMFQKLLE